MTKRKNLYILRRGKEFALFSIDVNTELAIICFQGNPVESPKSRLLRLPLEEARNEWKSLIDDHWSAFEKGLVPGAVMQRIVAWVREAEKDSPEYEDQLQAMWRLSYDGKTPAVKCRVENKNGLTRFFVAKGFYELKEGFTLHSRIGVGAGEGTILTYIPGTTPKQRGKRMR